VICADKNVFVDFFRGTMTASTDLLQKALADRQLLMSPFVLSELLSSPKLPKKAERYLLALPRLETDPTFFERAGLLRRKIYQKGNGVAMADIFIAQSCIDAEIPLLTLDQDLLMIAKHANLIVVGGPHR